MIVGRLRRYSPQTTHDHGEAAARHRHLAANYPLWLTIRYLMFPITLPQFHWRHLAWSA
jgi:hypothetical protein